MFRRSQTTAAFRRPIRAVTVETDPTRNRSQWGAAMACPGSLAGAPTASSCLMPFRLPRPDLAGPRMPVLLRLCLRSFAALRSPALSLFFPLLYSLPPHHIFRTLTPPSTLDWTFVVLPTHPRPEPIVGLHHDPVSSPTLGQRLAPAHTLAIHTIHTSPSSTRRISRVATLLPLLLLANCLPVPGQARLAALLQLLVVAVVYHLTHPLLTRTPPYIHSTPDTP